MVICKICGRKLKSREALGGHMSTAHPATPNESVKTLGENSKPETVQAEVEERDTGVEKPDTGEEISRGEEIRGYISKGYDYEQLTKRFGFDPRSVQREMEKVIPPASSPPLNKRQDCYY
ncbi:hypothetical protein M1O13_04020 [Dehalococcoidia bacterium]|nr:hypothetical protein [Dehalococcoidia bacterium]